MSVGRLFHTRGAATANARSPNLLRVRGTYISPLSANNNNNNNNNNNLRLWLQSNATTEPTSVTQDSTDTIEHKASNNET